MITSEERIEGLAAEGLLFEACAVQSMVAEALMSLAMFTAVSARDDLSELGLGKRLSDSGFGRLITLEANYRVFDHPELSELLERYARSRDFLVERHLPELQRFDYQEFLQTGREVLKALGYVYRGHARSLLRRQGLPTDGVFE